MGLFGSKKNKNGEKEKGGEKEKVVKTGEKTAEKTLENKKNAVVAAAVTLNENNRVILRPRITEKATLKADAENVFVFEIAQNATKLNVRKAVASIYNIIPTKISIARNPSKKVFSRGKRGVVPGVKKAYVYLKEGDKIEIV